MCTCSFKNAGPQSMGIQNTSSVSFFCWLHHLLQAWVKCVVQKHPFALCSKGETLSRLHVPRSFLSLFLGHLLAWLAVCTSVGLSVCLFVCLSVCFSVGLHQCVSSLPLILKWMVSCLDEHWEVGIKRVCESTCYIYSHFLTWFSVCQMEM